MSKNEIGEVYILTNPALPEFVKIGQTTDLDSRLGNLHSAVPEKYEVYALLRSSRYKELERATIETLTKLTGTRASNGEFFKYSPEQAFDLLSDLAAIAPDAKWEKDPRAGNRKAASARRGKGSLQDCGIKKGESITFKDGRKFKVASANSVAYNGKEYSLSGLAQELLGVKSVNGWTCFYYNGVRLDRLRQN